MTERVAGLLWSREDARRFLPLVAAGYSALKLRGQLTGDVEAQAAELAAFAAAAISAGNGVPEAVSVLAVPSCEGLVEMGEAGRRLGLSGSDQTNRRVRQLISAGALEGVREGQRWVGVTAQSLVAYLDGRTA